MKILYIWDADYPWDVRVEKICTTLANAGNEVHIAARNLKCLPEYENINGIHIHRLKIWSTIKINSILSFPAFFSPIWRKFLDNIIKKNNINIIIVRDLPMAPAGILAGKRNKIPVIFDMAEDYVSLIRAIWAKRKFQGLNLIVRNPCLAKLVERYSFRNADHIIVVVNEAIDVVLKSGGSSGRVTVVGNTPSLKMFKKQTIKIDNQLELIKNRFTAIYVGGIQMGRGLQVVIDALPEIIPQIPDFLFVVVGDGYATEQLKEKIRQKGVKEHVLWTGWVDHKLIYNYISLCNIGLIPHIVNSHKNTTVPNKLYDYMGLGLPVIASDAAPLKRIILEENCGKVFQSGDSGELARLVLEIFKSDSDYGTNGKNAVLNKYNWEKEREKIIEVVEKIICSRT